MKQKMTNTELTNH